VSTVVNSQGVTIAATVDADALSTIINALEPLQSRDDRADAAALTR
jgi:hypothetical protein